MTTTDAAKIEKRDIRPNDVVRLQFGRLGMIVYLNTTPDNVGMFWYDDSDGQWVTTPFCDRPAVVTDMTPEAFFARHPSGVRGGVK